MGKLALLGGEKAVKIDYDTQVKVRKISDAGIKKVISMMEEDEISLSPITKAFEIAFATRNGNRYAVCTPNGTFALLAAVFAIGIKEGDEVIVPSFSHWSTSSCVLHFGATPVFADIDGESFNLSAKSIQEKITDKTKAIIVTHIFGNPVNFTELRKLTRNGEIKIIEDCSHSFQAEWEGMRVGTLGDIGCFSLQGDKTLTAGEGGILVTNSTEYYEKVVTLGRIEKIVELSNRQYRKFILTGLGYKFRPHPLGIAIAQDSLERSEELSMFRNGNAKYLEMGISELPFIKIQKVDNRALKQYSYNFARYYSEKFLDISIGTFMKALKAEGVQSKFSGVGWNHKQPLYTNNITVYSYNQRKEIVKEKEVKLPITEAVADTIFLLNPRFEQKCDEILEQYIEAYKKIWKNAEALKAYEDANKIDKKSFANAMTNFRQRNKKR